MVLFGNTPCPNPNGMGLGEIYSGFKWGLKFFKSDVLPSLVATVGSFLFYRLSHTSKAKKIYILLCPVSSFFI